MKRILRRYSIKLAVSLVLLLLSWSVVLSPARSYAPIDDLINSVNQLRQSGQIFDATVAQNLITSLQGIATLVNSGNKTSAGQLLDAFNQEVNSLSGILMAPAAASQLVDAATRIASGL